MKREMRDLLVSWVTVSFAFTWSGVGALFSGELFRNFLLEFFVILVAVGTGFILHELAHKYLAIHYGAHAEFRAWNSGLLIALLLAFLTNGALVFAAPGAVYIFGDNISRKQNGLISLAGPLTNISIGLLALFLSFGAFGLLLVVLSSVARINLWLAFFNLVPIFPLDGSKVLTWNALVWALFFFPLAVYFFWPLIQLLIGF